MFAAILKIDPYHDALGRFSSTEGALSGDALKPVLRRWAGMEGGWQAVQHAARILIGGAPDSDQVENKKAMKDAKTLLASINAAPTIYHSLYRGLSHTEAFKDAKVGDTYSESLASWTGKKDIAYEFSYDKYGSNAAQRTGMDQNVVVVLKTSNAKGLSVSKCFGKNTLVGDADEWLTSGEYKITGLYDNRQEIDGDYISGPIGTKVVTVERVGNARGANIRKAEMFAKILVQKDWAAFDAMRKNPEAQKAAIAKNHDVAQGLLKKFNEVKNDPDKQVKLNDHMLKQGYIPDAADNGETLYLPLTGDTKSNKLPANPVAGHKVHIVLNHKTGHVDAVSRYT